MARDFLKLARELSLEDLRKLMDVKQQMGELEKRRAELQKELARVEKELASLQQGTVVRKRAVRGKKAGTPAAGKRKAKTAARASEKKAAAKAAKKVTRKGARGKAAPAKAKQTLEDVIAGLITSHGGKMSVKEILHAIQEGKLFKSKSKNFENVLRRTLSTSQRIVRAGRGVYKLK